MRKMTGRSLSDSQLITKSISRTVTLRLKPGNFRIPKREHTQMSDLQRSDRQKPSTWMTLGPVIDDLGSYGVPWAFTNGPVLKQN